MFYLLTQKNRKDKGRLITFPFFIMNKRIVRVPIESIGDVYGYSMIEYHMDFTETVNKLLKSTNINFKLQSTSYGGEYLDEDWRILFKMEKI